jgi:hypothetical protein
MNEVIQITFKYNGCQMWVEWVIFTLKSKINPYKPLSVRHSQLAKLIAGQYRKVIYWKRIRSRTWVKSKMSGVNFIQFIAPLLITLLIIINL